MQIKWHNIDQEDVQKLCVLYVWDDINHKDAWKLIETLLSF